MNNIILAIDLGKYKSVACVLDENTGEYRFTTVDNSRAEMRMLTRMTAGRTASCQDFAASMPATRRLIAAPWTPLASLCCRWVGPERVRA